MALTLLLRTASCCTVSDSFYGRGSTILPSEAISSDRLSSLSDKLPVVNSVTHYLVHFAMDYAGPSSVGRLKRTNVIRSHVSDGILISSYEE